MSVLDALLVCPSCGALPIDWTQRPTNVWQPIETAPHDATLILYFTPKPLVGGRYHMSRGDDRWYGAHWLESATHWMPLPLPPGPTP